MSSQPVRHDHVSRSHFSSVLHLVTATAGCGRVHLAAFQTLGARVGAWLAVEPEHEKNQDQDRFVSVRVSLSDTLAHPLDLLWFAQRGLAQGNFS